MRALAGTTDRDVQGVWIYRGLRWGLALVFLYAGAIKLADPYSFAILIEAYGLIPDALLMPTAIVLPALEVAAAIGLLFDLRGSLMVIAVLLAIFILVLRYGLWMGLAVDCGCFGPGDLQGQAYAGIRPALLRDFVLAGGIVLLYGWRKRFRIAPAEVHLSRFIIKGGKA